MTEQEIFDTVARHLLTQKAKAYHDPANGMCAYRTDDGLKCAVGCLIRDDEYSEEMECKTVAGLLENFDSFRERFADNEELLENLQAIHDDEEVFEWKQHLIWLAEEHGLDPAVLSEFPS